MKPLVACYETQNDCATIKLVFRRVVTELGALHLVRTHGGGSPKCVRLRMGGGLLIMYVRTGNAGAETWIIICLMAFKCASVQFQLSDNYYREKWDCGKGVTCMPQYLRLLAITQLGSDSDSLAASVPTDYTSFNLASQQTAADSGGGASRVRTQMGGCIKSTHVYR
jgi:hypothetical protein